GSAFFVDATGHEYVRLSFSSPSEARIREGVERLTRVMRSKVPGFHRFQGSLGSVPGSRVPGSQVRFDLRSERWVWSPHGVAGRARRKCKVALAISSLEWRTSVGKRSNRAQGT